MSAHIIDGRAVAADIEEEVRAEIARWAQTGQAAPGLHVVLCGDDPASATYVSGKQRASERVGIRSVVHRPPQSSTTEELLALVAELNADDDVDGILVQLPLPPQVDAGRVLELVLPEKDVDGLHPVNFGLLAQGRPRVAPCTPAGLMELLARYQVPVRGARAVVIGRSALVGRPVALLLTNADATVTVCHSRTVDLPGVCRGADILVAAMGKPLMIDASYVKPGACVLDVGTTRVEGKLRGDVDRESVEPVAGWLTPVPGGVGPMTIAFLLRNATTLARQRRAVPAGAH
jgi:methylenetetrahydrofolate dehydrogenase (NADP+)/methenyltetrahydrofolate cyclohydrolase